MAAQEATRQQYARALIAAMSEVLDEADDRHRELLLETADYWLAVGLVLGLSRAEEAGALLALLEDDTTERDELLNDALELLAEASR